MDYGILYGTWGPPAQAVCGLSALTVGQLSPLSSVTSHSAYLRHLSVSRQLALPVSRLVTKADKPPRRRQAGRNVRFLPMHVADYAAAARGSRVAPPRV